MSNALRPPPKWHIIRIATCALRINLEVAGVRQSRLQPGNAVFFVNLNSSFAMSPSKASVLAIGAAVLGFTIGVSALAVADFGMSGPGSQLGMPQYMKADSKAGAWQQRRCLGRQNDVQAAHG